jgi:hypothetical protein
VKKTVLLLLCLLFLSTPGVVQAQFAVSTNADGTLTIVSYTGPPGAIVIPTNINGLTVTAIGNNAFYGAGLNNITIPGTVTNIGFKAFAECPSLTNVSILGTVDIGSNAFDSCTNLTSVYISGGAIGYEAFQYCLGLSGGQFEYIVSGLSNLTLGSGVTSIGYEAFLSDPISNLFIPGSVTNIDAWAFADCSLTNVTFSYGLLNIGQEAFHSDPITSLIFPSSLTEIQGSAFYLCGQLTNVVVPASVTNVGSDAFTFCGILSNVLFFGNAPVLGPAGQGGPFINSGSNATIYYLPGTTGWPSSMGAFVPVPTALWNPFIQASGPGFGISNGQFGFNITGTANIPIVVEACTNLANPVWTPLTNMALTNGSVYFSDPNWTNFPVRYYGIGFP